MARIRKDKGYPAVFMLADYIQQENLSATITFFGPIAPECDADFNALLSSHDQVTSYGGILNPKDIQKTLSQYDVMVLPTTHYTEGFPGSVLDAYIAGIPVVVTEWEYAREFVDDGETGFVVPFKNSQQQLNESFEKLCLDRSLLDSMKSKAIKKREKYSEDEAWHILSRYL